MTAFSNRAAGIALSFTLLLSGLTLSPILLIEAEARGHEGGVSTTSNSNSGGSLGGSSSSNSSTSKSSSSGCCSGTGDSGRSTRTRNTAQTASVQSGDSTDNDKPRRRWFQFWKPREKEVGGLDLGSGR